MNKILLFAFSAVIMTTTCFAKDQSQKIIQSGWCSPNADFLLKNYKTMEANSPYDGVRINLEPVDSEGKVHSSHWFFYPKPIEREWFRSDIKKLQACKFTKFTDNFISISLLTYTKWQPDWFNDKEWDILCKNMGTIAWATKESGCKGILFDPEAYQIAVFKYRKDSQKSFKEVNAKVRERGKQLMEAMVKEYPGIAILGYWTFSVTDPILQKSTDPKAALPYFKYGLYPAFLNGFLDAMPPEARLYDGCEQAYNNDCEEDFLRLYFLSRHKVLEFIAPENIQKFKNQTETAFNIYIDAYLNPKGRWYIAKKGETRLESLRRNLKTACEYSGKYVWTWDEQCRWWDIKYKSSWINKTVMEKVGKNRLWQEAMPGICKAFEQARNPYTIPKKNTDGKNLVQNPGFENITKNSTIPTNWIYRNNEKEGVFEAIANEGFDKSAAVVAKTCTGYIYQYIPVKSGNSYAVIAHCKGMENLFPKIIIGWANKNKTRISYTNDLLIPFAGNAEWKKAASRVIAPVDVKYLMIFLKPGLLKKKLRKGKTENCFFDNITVYNIE